MIAEVRGIDPASGMIRLNPLYEFHEDLERSSPHHVEGRLERTEHAMENTAKLQMAGLQAGI